MELFGDSFGRSWSAVLGTCCAKRKQKNKLVGVVEGQSVEGMPSYRLHI